jgi:hypothetical protein
MSLLNTMTATCPHCGAAATVEHAASVNADRRPDLRDAILDDSFQVETCGSCGERFRLPLQMTYVDFDRGQWILAAPMGGAEEWEAAEPNVQGLFARNYGPAAAPGARELGERMAARMVFGWPALREKILARELGLDDVTLELLKIAVMRSVQNPPFADQAELRLIGGSEANLTFAWFAAPDATALTTLNVPREVYADIAGDAAWQALREDLSGKVFVDVRRLLG